MENLYLEYGAEFLEEQNPDEVPQPMEDLHSYLSTKTVDEIFSLGMFAYAYFGKNFAFNAAYFIIDAAGNIVSIESHQILRYYERVIDSRWFIDWLFDCEIINDSDYKDLQYAIS